MSPASAPTRVRGRDKSTWMYDEEGVPVARVADYRYDPSPRDPDLMLVVEPRMRRRDVDPAAVYRVMHGLLPLLEVTPCDRVEALSRIVRAHPDWSNRDIAEHVGTTDDVIAVHRRDSNRYRYGWLDSRKAARDANEE